jgi:hypothetical protein
MKKLLILGCAALALAGCSRGLLGGGGSSGPAAEPQIAVNNELAMPPDLALRAPSAAPPPLARSAASTGGDAGLYSDAPAAPVRPAATQDVYAKYGIDKFNPDGSKKSEDQLRKELRAAVLAEKKRKNPNYGTIFNVGELFSDN